MIIKRLRAIKPQDAWKEFRLKPDSNPGQLDQLPAVNPQSNRGLCDSMLRI